jgi:hypothetical protein
MRQKWLWTLILGVVACLCLAGWTSHANTSSTISWEYKVISTYGPSVTNPPPNVQQLNEAGDEGWELVDIRSGEFPSAGSHQVRTDFYLKRVK